MKILFCAYRDWALDVFDAFVMQNPGMELAKTPDEMERVARSEKWDVIVIVGWSWKVPADIVNSNLIIGMHPSDLPDYAGGSPIQNQILDGITETSATLFKLNEKFDKGEIIDKEPISLVGHLDEVLENIAGATVVLLHRFFVDYPNNTYTAQEGEGKSVRRLKPEHSRLPNPCELVEAETYGHAGGDEFNIEKRYTCKELWDFIRCREDPYPNAYFEDETGRLLIKWVEFEPK